MTEYYHLLYKVVNSYGELDLKKPPHKNNPHHHTQHAHTQAKASSFLFLGGFSVASGYHHTKDVMKKVRKENGFLFCKYLISFYY